MPFPTISTVLDDFNRANGALGANWGTLAGLGASAPSVDTNTWVAGDGYEGSYWSAATHGADCECYVTASDSAGAGLFFGVLLRLVDPGSAGTADAYGFHYAPDNGGEVYIVIYEDGVETEIGAREAWTTLTDGDAIGAEAISDALKLYTREGGTWTERVSRTNSVISGAGNMGLHTFDPGGIDLRLDDFSGGTIAGGGGGTVIPVLMHNYRRRRAQ